MNKLLGEKIQFDSKIALLVVVDIFLLMIDFHRTQFVPWAKWFPWKPLIPRLTCNPLVDLIGWELLFIGWLLLGFASKFGPEAIWLQAVPSTLNHSGKPEIETLSTLYGGSAFDREACRKKPFINPLPNHWFAGLFTILVSTGCHG